MKRKLFKEEIDKIFNYIYNEIPKHYTDDIKESIIINIKISLLPQLEHIEIYPHLVEKLINMIIESFIKSLIQPGEMVGCIAASSIGEQNTQASLNSVDWLTRVVVLKDNNCIEDCIGQIIDDEFDNDSMEPIKKAKTLRYDGKNETLNVPYCQVLDVSDKNYKINSVDENGKVSWQKITQLIRHPLYTGLIKVTTNSGRTVTATTGLSFLTMKDNKIVPINGSDLKVGDRIPITWSSTGEGLIENDKINMKHYLSPTEYIYGTDLWKAKEIRDGYYLKGYKRCAWWKWHHYKEFTLPFTRGDTAMESLEGVGKSKIGNEDIHKGFVYDKVRTNNIPRIPEVVQLDELFGFFIGIYLADGCVTDTYVAISKYEQNVLNKVKLFAESWNIGTHYTYIGYKYKHINKYEEKKGREVTEKMKEMEINENPADIRLHSKMFAFFIEQTCGRGSLNKHIPSFAYNAPQEFIKGMLDGLFSGDGTINDSGLTYDSISERLIDGIITILNKQNIFGIKKKCKLQEHNNKGSEVINQIYNIRICQNNILRFINIIKELTHKDKSIKLNNEKLNKVRSYEVFNEHHTTKKNKTESLYVLKDVYMDQIISIEIIDPLTIKFVYDFTVENTKNFEVLSGINLNDSFHSSGLFKANLTSGVVRLNELLNASKVIKTPALTIYFDTNKIDTTDLFSVKELCNSELIFFDIQNVLKKYQIDYFSDINEFEEDKEYYNFYSELFDEDFINCNYRLRLIFDKEILYKTKKSIEHIMETIIGYFKDSVDFCHFVFHADISCTLDIFFNNELCDPEDVLYKQEQEVLDELKHYINPDNKIIIFIEKIFLPCILPLKISGITGIEECYFNDDKDGTWFIDTKGGNYKEILLKEFVNFSKTKSNNMWDIFNMFGIEAARNFLIEDFSKIISVNHRHLDTLINSMTNTGKIMSVSRYGIDRKQVGPFAKAAFEQPFDNFFISATKGEIDNITGVSASVSLGKLANMGTGMIDVFINQNMIERELKKLENNNKKDLEKIEENNIEDDIMFDEELLNY